MSSVAAKKLAANPNAAGAKAVEDDASDVC